MNNKPVAWMDKESNITMVGGIYPKKLKKYLDGLEARIIAIESHPVKELTDEEIMVLYEEYIETQYASESNVLGFGRAILRKAQEK